MKYLYKKSKSRSAEENINSIEVNIFVPKLFRLTLPGEDKSLKLKLLRILFQTATFGKAKIYYVEQDGKIAHTTYLIPRCYKFPFMSKGDYEIGPCLTYPDFRGKGIYPEVLKHIYANVGSESTLFYMIVDENNSPSIRGIEKAGFERCGTVKVTKLIKRYLKE